VTHELGLCGSCYACSRVQLPPTTSTASPDSLINTLFSLVAGSISQTPLLFSGTSSTRVEYTGCSAIYLENFIAMLWGGDKKKKEEEEKDGVLRLRDEPRPDSLNKPVPREKLPKDLQQLVDRDDDYYDELYSQ
jgi:hypothetical protein